MPKPKMTIAIVTTHRQEWGASTSTPIILYVVCA